MNRLVVVEFTAEQDETFTVKKGQKYSYFQDPETGKFYFPVAGFEVTSDKDLSDRFFEVETE